MLYIVQQKDGKFRVLGNDICQTITTLDRKLGGAATNEMGNTFTVTVTDIYPAPFLYWRICYCRWHYQSGSVKAD